MAGLDEQLAERLIGIDGFRHAEHRLPGEVPRRFGFTGKEQAADFGKRGESLGIVGILRISVPQGVLIQLQAFVGDTTEHHGPEAAVADGQRLVPESRGLPIPEHMFSIRCPGQRRGNAGAVLPVVIDLFPGQGRHDRCRAIRSVAGEGEKSGKDESLMEHAEWDHEK